MVRINGEANRLTVKYVLDSLKTSMISPAADWETSLYWLALRLLPGLSGRNAIKLIQAFGSPAGIFHDSVTELRSVGLRTTIAESIHAGVSFDMAPT